MRRNVVFDMDGVLTELTQAVCKMNNIDYSRFDAYNIEDASLTKDEKALVYEKFSSLETFKAAKFLKSAKRLNELNNMCDVFVHTLCWNQDVADWKSHALSKLLPNIPKSRIVIDVGRDKQLIPGYIAVEDCAENLLSTENYTLGILLDKPYNRSKKIVDAMQSRNITRVNDLDCAIDYITLVLKEGK